MMRSSQNFTLPKVAIDVNRDRVTVNTEARYWSGSGQWVEFYMALVEKAASLPEAFLTARELQAFSLWSLKGEASVGKEVWRHLQHLEEQGVRTPVEHRHRGKTKAWRCTAKAQEIELLPSAERCDAWLAQRNLGEGGRVALPEDIYPWTAAATRSLLRFQEGRVQEALAGVREARELRRGSVLLGAVAELLEHRFASRVGEKPPAGEFLEAAEGAIGTALQIRQEILRAQWRRFDYLEGAVAHVAKLVQRMKSGPDINGLGFLFNSLGLLSRRAGRLRAADRYLRFSVAMLVASFDLPTLQAAVFNLGHTRYRAALRSNGELSIGLRFIQLDREICDSLGIGRDSAQAEVVAGLISLRLGEIEKAQEWLVQGRKLLEAIQSDYDRADLDRLDARIEWARAVEGGQLRQEGQQRALARYERALAGFQEVGYPTDETEREISALARGSLPDFLPSD